MYLHRRSARALLALLLGTLPLIGIATSAHGADSGALTWGFKASWRSYVTNIAAGTTSTSDGAGTNDSGEYVFPQVSTDLGSPGDTGVTKYEGSVRWKSSLHGFDITMADPWLEIESSSEAVLTAVLTDDAGNSRGRVEMATVDLDDPDVDADSLTWTDRPTVISEEAGESFGRYGNEAGDPLDSIVHADGIGEEPEPEPTATPTPTPEPTTSPTPGPTTKDAELIWGLKESFRSYITGTIAKGQVRYSGGAEVRGGLYVWDQSSASFDASGHGSAGFAGSVRFQGHESAETPDQYALDLELVDPQIVTSTSATGLSFRVIERSDGVTTDHGRVEFATISLAGASVCGTSGSRTWSNAPATITADGADVMDNYPAGTQLDPVHITVKDADLSGVGVRACTSDDEPDGGAGGGGGSTPRPTTPAPRDDEATNTTAGKLTWGVKESFRTYITGSIAKGSITVSDGAKTSGDLYQWGQESTSATNGIGTTDYFGTVRFTGHAGELDMTFGSPRVRVTSSESGSISFDMDGRRVEAIKLDLADGTRKATDGVVRWSNVPATLTGDGAAAFDDRYSSGTTMDRVSFVIGSNASADDDDSEEVASHSDDSSDLTPASFISALTDAMDGPDECPLTRASLTWGFKESFRSYISGSIAQGEWEVANGATYETPSFGWTKATGRATSSTKARVAFTGTVRFSGHNGSLNTTIANPTLAIAGDKATLALDVSGAERDAAMAGRSETQKYEDIAFASVNLSGLKRDGNTWSATEAPAVLTSAGHQAFDSYPAGTALDPVSFSVTFDDCVDSGGVSGAAAAAGREIAEALDKVGLTPWMGITLAAIGGAGLAIGADRGIRRVRSRS